MATSGDLEERLTTLEREVAELRQQLHGSLRRSVEDIAGSMVEVPKEEFQKFVRYAKEFRDAQTDPTD